MPVENLAPKPELVATEERPKEITIDLTTPVQAHGETIKKLTFRRPTAGDLIALGDAYPVSFMAGGGMRPNPPVMAELMTTLAKVPMSTIRQLDSEDFSTCAFRLTLFFIPSDRVWQS